MFGHVWCILGQFLYSNACWGETSWHYNSPIISLTCLVFLGPVFPVPDFTIYSPSNGERIFSCCRSTNLVAPKSSQAHKWQNMAQRERTSLEGLMSFDYVWFIFDVLTDSLCLLLEDVSRVSQRVLDLLFRKPLKPLKHSIMGPSN